MDIKERICRIVTNGVIDDVDREILANSLYYYCCDTDLTPLIAFGNQYKLYVYVDIVGYGSGDFIALTEGMYRRLEDFGFKKTCSVHNGSRYIENESKPVFEQSALTGWIKKSDCSNEEDEPFYILYIQGDAPTVYRILYSAQDCGGHSNYIMPKCVCNYYYEILPYENVLCRINNYCSQDILAHVEKRVEYIMGHCHSNKYREIGLYKYNGQGDEVVPLYKRICYYLW